MKAVPVGELKAGAEKEGGDIQKAQREKLLYPLLTATDISLPGSPWGQLEKSLLSCPNDLYNGLKQL